MWTATILLTLLPAADKNEAEQLFSGMEKKLTSTKLSNALLKWCRSFPKIPR